MSVSGVKSRKSCSFYYHYSLPSLVDYPPLAPRPPGLRLSSGEHVRDIALGWAHSIVLSSDGQARMRERGGRMGWLR